MLAIIFYILMTVLPGAAVLAMLPPRSLRLGQRIALAFGVGSALVALELFLYFVVGRFGFFSGLYWFFGAQSLAAAVILARRIPWRQQMVFVKFRGSVIAWILGILISSILLLGLVQALGNPPAAFDSIAFWAMRAEILKTDGRVDFNQDSPTYLSAYTHSNYPWHLSFQEYWLRQLGARGGEVNSIAWLYFLSLILLLADFLIKRLGTEKGLLLTLFCCSQPLLFYHGSNNYADLIIAYYATAAFILFFEWLEEKQLVGLVLSAALVSWTICIKNYGIFYIIAFLVGLVLARLWRVHHLSMRDWLKVAAGLLLPLLPLAAFKLLFRLNLRNTDAAWVWHPETITSFGKAMFVSGNWNIWWVIFCITAILLVPTIWKKKSLLVCWLMFSAVALIIVVIFMITENYQWALDQTALSRALIPMVPISIALLGFSLANKNSSSSV